MEKGQASVEEERGECGSSEGHLINNILNRLFSSENLHLETSTRIKCCFLCFKGFVIFLLFLLILFLTLLYHYCHWWLTKTCVCQILVMVFIWRMVLRCLLYLLLLWLYASCLAGLFGVVKRRKGAGVGVVWRIIWAWVPTPTIDFVSQVKSTRCIYQ